MIFAAWHRGGSAPTDPVWRRVVANRERGGCTSLDIESGFVSAGPPARIVATADGAIAWRYPGSPTQRLADARGPHLRASPGSISLTTGILPQVPLYYFRAPNDAFLVVSSELGQLARMVPNARPNVRRVIEQAMRQWPADDGATTFHDFRRVRARERIGADAAGIHVERDRVLAEASYLRMPREGLVRELRSLLEKSIIRAMSGVQRVAVLAGGGLDSAGVLALAVAQCRGATARHIEAIAAQWASPGDDRPHLEALERELGIVAVRLPAAAAGPWVLPSLCLDAQPQVAPAACIDLLLWRAAIDRGADIALAGHAGDYVLAGEISFAPLLLSGHPLLAVRGALRLKAPRELSPLSRIAHWLAVPLVRPHVPSRLRHRIQRRHIAPWFRPRFFDLLRESFEATPRAPPRTPAERLERFCSGPVLSELAVSWGQLSAAVPAPIVDVLRDPELVEFLAQVNPTDLLADDVHRGLYRQALKGALPESVRLRRDKALAWPAVIEAVRSSDARATFEELGSLRALATEDLADPTAFRPHFAAWLAAFEGKGAQQRGSHDEWWYKVWQLLSLEAYFRQYVCPARTRRD